MIVCVAGGFDPIHEGHIDHLEKAATICGREDRLVVILATDEQLIRKKGFCFQKYEARERILSSLKMVDYVYPNIDKDTACAETLRLLRPRYFIKGGDRKPDNMPTKELEVCREIGCEIIYGLGDLLNSSTALVKRMEEYYGNVKKDYRK